MTQRKMHKPKHPFAFENCSGAFDMMAGDRIVHIETGKRGVADEFTHDGDVFISLDDGTFDCVRWRAVRPERSK